MSRGTPDGVYCRQCHKRRPASHFEECPDHASAGPKLTLAERRELDTGEDPRPRRAAPRPGTQRATPYTSGQRSPAEAWGVQWPDMPEDPGGGAELPGWAQLTLLGVGLAILGAPIALAMWASRQGAA